jgi:mannose-binding lectin 2
MTNRTKANCSSGFNWITLCYLMILFNAGPVFGNQDYFTGLAIFFDTYSNHNGEHSHEHPYISAMINNGSIHYDHDRDGTHSQVSGCHAKFRNSNEDTYVAISYINRQLIVMTNFDGSGTWTPCFLVNNVDLPTGYYFGFTAATGDLAGRYCSSLVYILPCLIHCVCVCGLLI